MLPLIIKPPISRKRKAVALAFAGVVDLLQIAVFPAFGGGVFSPFEDALDFVTAFVLMGVCGFKWQFVLAFLLELTPFVDLFPTWTAVVLTLPTAGAEEKVRASAVPPVQAIKGGRDPVEIEAVVVPPKRDKAN